MAAEENMKRMHVRFSGRVQGVGFRFTTRHTAERYLITGFIRNCFDGDVELVAEGAQDELINFLNGVRNSSVGRYIIKEQVEWLTATGEFETFGISF